MDHPFLADTVVAEIVAAFPVKPLDPASAPAEWGTTYLAWEHFQTNSSGSLWNQLPSRFLEFHHDSVGFLSPISFAAYLPAFLIAVIERADEIDVLPVSLLEALTRKNADPRMGTRFDACLGYLTYEQRLAVARGLSFLEGTLPQGLEKRLAKSALDSYWRELLD